MGGSAQCRGSAGGAVNRRTQAATRRHTFLARRDGKRVRRGGHRNLLFAAGAVLLLGRCGLADEIYWQAGVGNWFSAGNWYDNNYGSNQVPGGSDDAYVVNGGTAQISGDAAVSTLWVGQAGGGEVDLSAGSLSVSGSEHIGDGGIGVFSQTGGTNTINSGIYALFVGGAAGSNPTGTYILSGGGSLVATGAEFIGNTTNGTFTQTSGTNTIDSGYDLDLGDFSGASGTYNLSGTGALSVSGDEEVGNSGVGAFNLSGAGALSVSGSELVGNSGVGVFTQTGGTNTISSDNSLFLGDLSGSQGTYTLSSTGVLTANNEFVGNEGTGTFNQTGGTNNVGYSTSYSLFVGNSSGSIGTYNLSGTGAIVASNESIGNSGTGTFNQTGGTNTVGSTLTIAANAGSTGTYNLQGGTLSAGALNDYGAFVQSAGNVGVSGAMQISNGGSYTISGASIDSAGNLYLGGSSSSSSGTGALTLNGGALTVSGSSQVWSGGTINLTGGVLALNGSMVSSGSININGGTLSLSGPQGTLSSTSPIEIALGGTLQLDNRSMSGGNSTVPGGRLGDSMSLYMNGGTFSYLGADNTASTETLGALQVVSGASTVSLVNGNTGTTAVTFSGGLVTSGRQGGATLNFAGSNLGTTNQVVFTGQPAGFIAGWATVDNGAGNDANFAKYDLTAGVIPLSPSDYASSFGSGGNVRLTGPTSVSLSASASISTLTFDARSGSVTLNQAGNALTLTQGGLLDLGTYLGTLTGGTLTSGRADGEIDTYVQSGASLEVDSQIIDGSTHTSLVKSGPGLMTLGGSSSNTFSGTTYVRQGQLDLNKSGGAYAINGPLVVTGGTLTQFLPGQLGPNTSMNVTSGTVTMGPTANSIGAYVITGGQVSAAGQWNVTSASLEGGATTTVNGNVWTIGAVPPLIRPLTDQSVLDVSGGTTQIGAGTSTIVEGSTTFIGNSGPTIQVNAGSSSVSPGTAGSPAGAGLLKLQGDVYVTGTAGVAGIVTGTVGNGQIPGVLDLNGVLRTFSISSGGTFMISAKVTDGGINVSGSGLMELMANNTYSMGTTLSGGTLMVASSAELGSGPINFQGGTLGLRSDSSTASFSEPLTTTASGSINLDLGPVTTSNTTPCGFTMGAGTFGVAMTLTGTAGESLTLPGISLLNNTSGAGASPTSIHNSANLIVNGPITMGARGANGDILKDQAGTLTFEGSTANTYTGTTTVSGGTLELDKSANVDAIPHNLDVFGGGTVQLLANGQIDPSSHIILDAVPTAAVLDLNGFNNTFGNTSGTVFLSFVAGGTLMSGSGNATLGGDVQFTGTSGTAMISGNLGLGAAGRTFTIARGSAAEDMQVSANITGGPSSGTAITKAGPGILALSGANTYAGNTTVNGGTLIFGASGAFPNGNALTINAGTTEVSNLVNSNKILLQASGLTFGGSSGTWAGQLDLTSNDMVVHNGVIANIANQLKTGFNAGSGYWNGAGGIISTTAAADSTHLTTLGYRTGGSPMDGVNTTSSDVLVMYTYYGDANLDGTVNGADYQQIDLGFGQHLTGWSNGDFNYDGIIDGSDYSLIDNTYNQINATGASPLAIIADPSDLIASPSATSAVPEPGAISLLSFAVLGVLGQRHRRG